MGACLSGGQQKPYGEARRRHTDTGSSYCETHLLKLPACRPTAVWARLPPAGLPSARYPSAPYQSGQLNSACSCSPSASDLPAGGYPGQGGGYPQQGEWTVLHRMVMPAAVHVGNLLVLQCVCGVRQPLQQSQVLEVCELPTSGSSTFIAGLQHTCQPPKLAPASIVACRIPSAGPLSSARFELTRKTPASLCLLCLHAL